MRKHIFFVLAADFVKYFFVADIFEIFMIASNFPRDKIFHNTYK